jgi:hypothetical protein
MTPLGRSSHNPRMPDQRWRFPLTFQAVSLLIAAVNIVLIRIMFVTALAIPLMAIVAIIAILVSSRRIAITLSRDRGTITIRTGLLSREFPLTRISSVKKKRTGIDISFVAGRQVCLGTNWVVSWLHMTTPAEEIAWQVTRAAEDAKASHPHEPAHYAPNPLRNNRAMVLLAGIGLVGIGSAFLVRFSWPNPLLTAVAVLFALYIGLTGLFLLVFALWVVAGERRAQRS